MFRRSHDSSTLYRLNELLLLLVQHLGIIFSFYRTDRDDNGGVAPYQKNISASSSRFLLDGFLGIRETVFGWRAFFGYGVA